MNKSKKYDFDAIVVGSGMSGGYAAKEFCEKGYKTLVLDRGKPLTHRQYKTEGMPPWDMEFRGKVHQDQLDEEQSIQQKCWVLSDFTKHHFINDKENPYEQDQPFDWIRSSHVGGKSLLWARQCYRWSDLDFTANAKDGHGVDWPIRYKDIEPWYDNIEEFVGIAGSYENIPHLPDSKFLPPIELNVVEREIIKKLKKSHPDRHMIPSRTAHLTEPKQVHLELGRGQCQARNECQRGCSFGGYYSSISGSLPAAERTGNMTLTPNAQVQEVLYDEVSGKASGVRYVDTVTKKSITVTSKVVFMCASTLGTLQILMNSTSKTYPKGIGNTSGVLGHYIMDHNGGSSASGNVPGHLESYYKGRRQDSIYVARFRNVKEQDTDFLRGYGYQGWSVRSNWSWNLHKTGVGEAFKNDLKMPGGWHFGLGAIGEMLPTFENQVSLHSTKKDQWGMPLLVTNVTYGENTRKMKEDMMNSAVEMLKAAGLTDVKGRNTPETPGIVVHEMGGACMGKDPKTSYLNKWNQSHEVSNLFVTDGASFSSGSCVNPSLTFMAFTARAVDYADKQLKSGLL